jgi:hypothetical protein
MVDDEWMFYINNCIQFKDLSDGRNTDIPGNTWKYKDIHVFGDYCLSLSLFLSLSQHYYIILPLLINVF